MTIDDRLREGYRHFRDVIFEEDRRIYEDLADFGQTPHTLVITCSDSRVIVQQILNAGPGDLFVVRNVAAMVPPYETDAGYHGTSAAIEFAVTVLEVDNVVVMGHVGCGGVANVVDHALPEESFVGRWMRPLQDWAKDNGDSFTKDPTLRKRILERAAVNLSIENLKSFPFVAERVEAGTLKLSGLVFDIRNGDLVEVLDRRDTNFNVRSVLADAGK
ncbi:carbonic anhydrase [Kordiimonas marina]|uniref:carbonic anhydrase n=1 Tax=Kordiimonas marina TaxID=2872312 RepID=UPI001FF61BA5|nr:carbonic anhydrase [Kordiimonas marina]MCJ9427510.1 carbonic anhydrase [Kordiimonas marina]